MCVRLGGVVISVEASVQGGGAFVSVKTGGKQTGEGG